MEIELNIPDLNSKCRTAFENCLVGKTIDHELQKICARHKEAAIQEMQEFIAQVATSQQMTGFGMGAKIIIRLPDSKNL